MRLWNRKKQADAFFPPRSRRSTCAERNLSSLHRRLARYAREEFFSVFYFLFSLFTFLFYLPRLPHPLSEVFLPPLSHLFPSQRPPHRADLRFSIPLHYI